MRIYRCPFHPADFAPFAPDRELAASIVECLNTRNRLPRLGPAVPMSPEAGDPRWFEFVDQMASTLRLISPTKLRGGFGMEILPGGAVQVVFIGRTADHDRG